MNVCHCQRIHITTCISIRAGPITGSLGWFYAGLLTWKQGAFVHWHFHFGPLGNWVTGAHHAAQKKGSEHAEAENSHKLSVNEYLLPFYCSITKQWNCVSVRSAFSHRSPEMTGDPGQGENGGNAKIAVSCGKTVAGLWGQVHFICFILGSSAILLVLKKWSSKEEWIDI